MIVRKRVFIVEDHVHLAEALTLALKDDPRFETCGVAGDFREAISMMMEAAADLVIVDLNLPGGSGLDLIPTLRDINPAARYLMFSQEDPSVISAIAREAGANGYLRKGASLDAIRQVVGIIVSGGEYFPGTGTA